jgi:hypothetical protein
MSEVSSLGQAKYPGCSRSSAPVIRENLDKHQQSFNVTIFHASPSLRGLAAEGMLRTGTPVVSLDDLPEDAVIAKREAQGHIAASTITAGHVLVGQMFQPDGVTARVGRK